MREQAIDQHNSHSVVKIKPYEDSGKYIEHICKKKNSAHLHLQNPEEKLVSVVAACPVT
jgi:hypothetical protein